MNKVEQEQWPLEFFVRGEEIGKRDATRLGDVWVRKQLILYIRLSDLKHNCYYVSTKEGGDIHGL